jgi:hypothetical protein
MGKRKFSKMRRKWVKGPPENETKMGKIKQDKRLTPGYYYKEKIAAWGVGLLSFGGSYLIFGK